MPGIVEDEVGEGERMRRPETKSGDTNLASAKPHGVCSRTAEGLAYRGGFEFWTKVPEMMSSGRVSPGGSPCVNISISTIAGRYAKSGCVQGGRPQERIRHDGQSLYPTNRKFEDIYPVPLVATWQWGICWAI